jgi:type IV secretory pathway VirB4 component
MATQLSAKNAQPSQDFVPIEQVRDGVLVLKDGSIRTILMASSINIVLKSEDEQVAIIRQFQNFLNSLDFSVQIFIQSRELDIRPYIALLEQRLTEQQSELMRIQVREYIDFVKNFVQGSSIMTKGFYIVVPYTPSIVSSEDGNKGRLSQFFSSTQNSAGHQVTPELFEEYRSQIEQRVSVVVQGLARTGVRVAQLGTEEVVELFYRLFNIGELDRPLPVSELSKA